MRPRPWPLPTQALTPSEPLELLRILQVVFGIGLVIFIHEAGHFIAARLCRVRVEVFSLGFGPRLLGWKRGGTTYQIAAIPIGGYVKMAGEMPDPSGRPPRGDELYSKGVWQRFFIYSGGVLMNVIFALIAFPLVFLAGVPVTRPIIDAPVKGMPAWRAGLEAGTEIVAIDGEEMFDFTNIFTAVALADPGPLEVTVRRPGSEELEVLSLEPERDPEHGIYRIGVELGVDPALRLRVADEGPAHEAGLRDGDILVAVEGSEPGLSPARALHRAMLAGRALDLVVQRDGETREVRVEPEQVSLSDRLRFGFQPLQNQVKGVRPNPDLEALDLALGERIAAVDGQPVHDSASLRAALLAAQGAPLLRIETAQGTLREARFSAPLSPAAILALDEDLYLGFDPESTRVAVAPGQAVAQAGLRDGDRITALSGVAVTTWEELFTRAQLEAARAEPVSLAYQRPSDPPVGEPITWQAGELEVTPQPFMIPAFGFDLEPAGKIYRTASVLTAIREGFGASKRFLEDTWLTLKKMVTGRVSTRNMGGVITIGAVSYSWAAEGWAKLFFFLCMLSINLALLNVLPIPVLDGGHLFFLVIEAIKGSPVSERTLGYSQIIGLVVILTLMVYVTYQDVLRIL